MFQVDSKSWRSCKWCRFQKCLSSGLKPSWVLDKTQRKRRHLRTVQQVASNQQIASNHKTSHQDQDQFRSLVTGTVSTMADSMLQEEYLKFYENQLDFVSFSLSRATMLFTLILQVPHNIERHFNPPSPKKFISKILLVFIIF